MKIKGAARRGEPASFNLHKPEFAAVSKKKNFHFHFELEMKNGRTLTNLLNDPLGRGLADCMRENAAMMDLIEKSHIKINVTDDAVMTISIIAFAEAGARESV